jgi:putative endonuclease
LASFSQLSSGAPHRSDAHQPSGAPQPSGEPRATNPSTTAVGRTAEGLVAAHLERGGYTVLDRNWRNRWCELDLVARGPAGATHFIEVKYRRNPAYGYAAEYITRDKSSRLIRAAAAWCQAHAYAGPYQIDVATVEGSLTAPAIAVLPNAIFA